MVLLHESVGMPCARGSLLLTCLVVISHSIPLQTRPLPPVTEKIASLPSMQELSTSTFRKFTKPLQGIKAMPKDRLKDRGVKAFHSITSTPSNHQGTLLRSAEGARFYEELASEPIAKSQGQQSEFITDRMERQAIERLQPLVASSTVHMRPTSKSFQSIDEDFTTFFEQEQKKSFAAEFQHIEPAPDSKHGLAKETIRLPRKPSPDHRSGRRHFPEAAKKPTHQFRKTQYNDFYKSNVFHTPATQMPDNRLLKPADLSGSAAPEADWQEEESSTVTTESQTIFVDLRQKDYEIAPTSPIDVSYDGDNSVSQRNSGDHSFSPVNLAAEILVDDTVNIFESLKSLNQMAGVMEDQSNGMVSPIPHVIQHLTEATELKDRRRSFFLRDWHVMAISIIALEVATICLLILSSKLRRCRNHRKMNNMKRKQSKFGYGYEFKSLEDDTRSISKENQNKGALRGEGNDSLLSKSKANLKQGNIYTEPPVASACQKKNNLQSLQADEPIYVDVEAWQKVPQLLRMKDSNLVETNEYSKANKDLSCKASTQAHSAIQEHNYLSIVDVTKQQNFDTGGNFEICESFHDTKNQPVASGSMSASRRTQDTSHQLGAEDTSHQLGPDRSDVAVKSQLFVEQGESSMTSGVRFYVSRTTESEHGANAKTYASACNSSSSAGRDAKQNECDTGKHPNDDTQTSSNSTQETSQDVGGENKVGKVWDKYKYFFEAERQFRSYSNASSGGSKAADFSTQPASGQQTSDWREARKRKRMPGMNEEERMVLRKQPRLQTVVTPPPQQSDTLRPTYSPKEKDRPQPSTSGSSLEIVNMRSHERLPTSSTCITDPVSRIDLCQAERVPSECSQSQFDKNLEAQFLPGDTADGVAGTMVRKVRRRIDKKKTGEKWL